MYNFFDEFHSGSYEISIYQVYYYYYYCICFAAQTIDERDR